MLGLLWRLPPGEEQGERRTGAAVSTAGAVAGLAAELSCAEPDTVAGLVAALFLL